MCSEDTSRRPRGKGVSGHQGGIHHRCSGKCCANDQPGSPKAYLRRNLQLTSVQDQISHIQQHHQSPPSYTRPDSPTPQPQTCVHERVTDVIYCALPHIVRCSAAVAVGETGPHRGYDRWSSDAFEPADSARKPFPSWWSRGRVPLRLWKLALPVLEVTRRILTRLSADLLPSLNLPLPLL